MAFSTQKEFFHVPFMNETVEFECKKECVKLKSYASTFDDRSWAIDEDKQSKFLSDLVTCNTPVGGRDTKGSSGDGIESAPKASTSARLRVKDGDRLSKHGVSGKDKLDEVLKQNKYLQKQLDISNQSLKAAKDENAKMKSMLKGFSEKDVENINAIIEERNELRKKCKKFKDIEKKVNELQKKAREADHISDNLTYDLDDQAKYIDGIENELKCMHEYYENKMQKLNLEVDLWKEKVNETNDALMFARCEAQKVQTLERNIAYLNDKLREREDIINEYSYQQKQLTYKVKRYKNCGYRMPPCILPEAAQDSNLLE